MGSELDCHLGGNSANDDSCVVPRDISGGIKMMRVSMCLSRGFNSGEIKSRDGSRGNAFERRKNRFKIALASPKKTIPSACRKRMGNPNKKMGREKRVEKSARGMSGMSAKSRRNAI